MSWDLSLFSEAERKDRADKKKEAETQLKKLFENFHIRRLPAEVRIKSEDISVPSIPIAARILSTDFATTQARLYLRSPIKEETEISFTILENERIFIKGKIQWCKRGNLYSVVKSKDPFPYRAEIKFDFSSLIEKENVRLYASRFNQKFVRSGPPHPKSGKLL